MDITTAAHLAPELPADHPLVQALREVAEYKEFGAEAWMLPGYDLEPYEELRRMSMVSWTQEPAGIYEPDGWTERYTTIIRITEDGLAELVCHGRER